MDLANGLGGFSMSTAFEGIPMSQLWSRPWRGETKWLVGEMASP